MKALHNKVNELRGEREVATERNTLLKIYICTYICTKICFNRLPSSLSTLCLALIGAYTLPTAINHWSVIDVQKNIYVFCLFALEISLKFYNLSDVMHVLANKCATTQLNIHHYIREYVGMHVSYICFCLNKWLLVVESATPAPSIIHHLRQAYGRVFCLLS